MHVQGERDNCITVGGMLLERKSGGMTHIDPIVRYSNIRDDQVQEFWHYIGSNSVILKALSDCKNIVMAELAKWGDERLKPQK